MTPTENEGSSLSVLQVGLSWLTSLAVPVVLVLLVVRAVMHPWFLEFEYRTPGFPEDPYGFTLEERLHWSKISVQYLVNDAGIESLGDLRFPVGQQIPEPSCSFVDDCTRLYNERELGHLVDVKEIVGIAMIVLWAGLAVLVFSAIIARRTNAWLLFKHAVGRGGWLTTLLMVGILGFVLLAFSVIFVAFHELFFAPGTWTFFYSDTLIRLFPERFWRDTFLIVGGIPALVGAILGYRLRN